MNEQGKIFLEPTEEQIKKEKLALIPKEDAERVINMNRAERRKYYRELRKKKLPGE